LYRDVWHLWNARDVDPNSQIYTNISKICKKGILQICKQIFLTFRKNVSSLTKQCFVRKVYYKSLHFWTSFSYKTDKSGICQSGCEILEDLSISYKSEICHKGYKWKNCQSDVWYKSKICKSGYKSSIWWLHSKISHPLHFSHLFEMCEMYHPDWQDITVGDVRRFVTDIPVQIEDLYRDVWCFKSKICTGMYRLQFSDLLVSHFWKNVIDYTSHTDIPYKSSICTGMLDWQIFDLLTVGDVRRFVQLQIEDLMLDWQIFDL